MSDLSKRHCTKNTEVLKGAGLQKIKGNIDEHWDIIKDTEIDREFLFKNFQEALDFTNHVGKIAEKEGHHPSIELQWGKVKIKLSTHKVHGLSENDFILASKIDNLYRK